MGQICKGTLTTYKPSAVTWNGVNQLSDGSYDGIYVVFVCDTIAAINFCMLWVMLSEGADDVVDIDHCIIG